MNETTLKTHVTDAIKRNTGADFGTAADRAAGLFDRFPSVRYSARLFDANDITAEQLDHAVAVAVSNL